MWHCRAAHVDQRQIDIDIKMFPYLDDSVRHFRTRDDRVCAHHSVGVLLTDLGDQEGTHTRTGTTTKGVCDLET